MKIKNPLAIIEESFKDLKKILADGLKPMDSILNAEYLSRLQKETKSLLRICEELNNDLAFIQKINQLPLDSKTLVYFHKTENFFLSDLVNIANSKNGLESPKSLFGFAYYYDVLRNHHFADAKELASMNKLAAESEFKLKIEKIKQQYLIQSKDSSSPLFLIPLLAEIEHPLLSQISHISRFLCTCFIQ